MRNEYVYWLHVIRVFAKIPLTADRERNTPITVPPNSAEDLTFSPNSLLDPSWQVDYNCLTLQSEVWQELWP